MTPTFNTVANQLPQTQPEAATAQQAGTPPSNGAPFLLALAQQLGVGEKGENKTPAKPGEPTADDQAGGNELSALAGALAAAFAPFQPIMVPELGMTPAASGQSAAAGIASPASVSSAALAPSGTAQTASLPFTALGAQTLAANPGFSLPFVLPFLAAAAPQDQTTPAAGSPQQTPPAPDPAASAPSAAPAPAPPAVGPAQAPAGGIFEIPAELLLTLSATSTGEPAAPPAAGPKQAATVANPAPEAAATRPSAPAPAGNTLRNPEGARLGDSKLSPELAEGGERSSRVEAPLSGALSERSSRVEGETTPPAAQSRTNTPAPPQPSPSSAAGQSPPPPVAAAAPVAAVAQAAARKGDPPAHEDQPAAPEKAAPQREAADSAAAEKSAAARPARPASAQDQELPVRAQTPVPGAGTATTAAGKSADLHTGRNSMPLPPETARSVVDQVIRGLSLHVGADAQEIRLTLKPESLGTVLLQVKMEEGKMDARIEVAQPAVKTAIEGQLTDLRQALSARGIEVQHIEVLASGQSATLGNRDGNNPARFRQKGGRRVEASDPEEVDTAARSLGYNTIELIM